MTVWITVAAAVFVVTAASAWMSRRVRPHRERPPAGPHWGDWPPDQMST